MEFLKISKGAYGYIDAKKKRQLLWTMILFAIVGLIFGTGVLIYKTRLNVLTVAAVVGVLPAAKALISYVVLFRYHTFDRTAFDKIMEHAGTLLLGFDYVITTEKKEYPIQAAAVCQKTICLFTTQQDMEEKQCVEYIKNILKSNKYEGNTIKIYKSLPEFLERLDEMNDKLSDHERKEREEQAVLGLLGALSY